MKIIREPQMDGEVHEASNTSKSISHKNDLKNDLEDENELSPSA